MLEISRYCLMASTALTALAALCYLAVLTARHSPAARTVTRGRALVGAGAPAEEASAPVGHPELAEMDHVPGPAPRHLGVAWLGARLVDISLAVLTASLVTRMIHTGHAPFSNQYEFAVAFAWGMLVAFEYFQWRYQTKIIGLLVLPMTVGMLFFAGSINSAADPLVPALQNQWLLPTHVVTAVLGYGAAAVASGAGILYLLSDRIHLPAMPGKDLLDELGYRAVVAAFPMITLTNILGAIWADIAWGRYWSWDPKETASAVTWLIYGAYLHARVVRDWRGNRSAWLLILGFVAVLFTFFGNYFFGGLHAYA